MADARPALALFAAVSLAMPGVLAARDSLGVFSGWAAFRDPGVPRCYAIGKAQPSRARREFQPYAAIGTWPKRKLRGQVHFRLSRTIRQGSDIALTVGERSFELRGGGADAWARGAAMDAAIVAAMRSADTMRVRATDRSGRRFTSTYRLAGSATAMDAATVACARG